MNDENYIKKVGPRIKLVRKNMKINQMELGQKYGLTKQTILNYEKGHRFPNFDFLIPFIKEFNVNAHWLLTGEGEMFLKTDISPDSKEEMLKILFGNLNENLLYVLEPLLGTNKKIADLVVNEYKTALLVTKERYSDFFRKVEKG